MTMTPYATAGTPKRTPQSESIPDREAEMVENNAGGVTFALDVWGRLDRFLILGTEGGTYYASERKHTAQALEAVRTAVASDGRRAVDRIVSISEAGRAPKNDPAIYALAVALKAGDAATRAAASAAVPRVCRIGTHILHLAEAVKSLGGWGRGTRRAFSGWYLGQPPERLAYQLVKYQARDGWSHRDILRKAHPKVDDAAVNAALRWAARGEAPSASDALRIVEGFEKVKAATAASEVAALIRDYKLPREAVPTSHLGSPLVWDALLEDMPLGAMVRNLGKMSAIGLLSPLSAAASKVTAALADRDSIRRSRLHPLALLVALKTYAQGHGERGKLSWTAVGPIVDALDAAFYLAFDNVEPTGKRWLLACDVSGSMDGGLIAGMPGVTPRVAVGALAMVTAKVEPQHQIVGFTAARGGYGGRWGGGAPELTPISIGGRTRLDDVCKTMAALPMGGTDCSLPMVWAQSAKIPVDVFVVLTDNETWAGDIHPSQALTAYRQATGIAAKLVVVGMTATEITIADPKDAGMLDCVGFDAAAPAIMADFATR